MKNEVIFFHPKTYYITLTMLLLLSSLTANKSNKHSRKHAILIMLSSVRHVGSMESKKNGTKTGELET